MAVVPRRVTTNLMVQLVDMDLVDLEGTRGVLKEADKYQINILHDISPPSVTNLIEEGLWNDAVNTLGVVQSLRVILTVPNVTM